MKYHNYIFFDIKDSIRNVDTSGRAEYSKAFAANVGKDSAVRVFLYDTLGMKTNHRFMLWFQSEDPRLIQKSLHELMRSELGQHLTIIYTLFGMTRPSVYTKDKAGTTTESQILDMNIERSTYLIIYPFTKTVGWYLLPFEERRRMMGGHVKVGKTFAPIRQLLLYAFGVDDHEFVVSYETESLADFQSLVMELRSTEARAYTKSDTPIFVCTHCPIKALVDLL